MIYKSRLDHEKEYASKYWLVSVLNFPSNSSGAAYIGFGHAAILVEGSDSNTDRKVIGFYQIFANTSHNFISDISIFDDAYYPPEIENLPKDYSDFRSFSCDSGKVKAMVTNIKNEHYRLGEITTKYHDAKEANDITNLNDTLRKLQIQHGYSFLGVKAPNCAKWCLEKLKIAGIGEEQFRLMLLVKPKKLVKAPFFAAFNTSQNNEEKIANLPKEVESIQRSWCVVS